MTSVVVVGSVNLDAVTVCDRFPEPGETVRGTSIAFGQGGKGANQARAAARAGASTEFIGAVGADAAADTVLASLTGAGVDVGRVAQVPGSTGYANVTVDAAGENHIVVIPGANDAVTVGPDTRIAIAAAEVLVLQLEIPIAAVLDAARAARAAGTAVVLNPSPVRPLPEELAGLIDAMIVNRAEAEDLREHLGRIPLVVTTLGADGARARGPEGEVHCAGFPVSVVDTTGAGDAFAGTFAANWHLPLARRLARANAAGALTAAVSGAASAPTAREIEALAG